MKLIFLFIAVLFGAQVFAQSNTETEVLNLSNDLFRYEVDSKYDSVANLLDEKFVVVGSAGTKRSKSEYMTDLKNGKPVHNSIEVQESSVVIQGNTAIVLGKGIFNVSSGGNKISLNLSYMEVFIKERKEWKLLGLYAHKL